MIATAPPPTWHREAPASSRALATMPHPDYTDVFTGTLHAPFDMPPDRWVRGLLRTVPRHGRLFLGAVLAVQRLVLGLRLPRRPTPDGLLGWTVTGRGDDWLRLDAASPMMRGQLVFRADGRQLSVATFVRYERRRARVIWPPVSILHRAVGLALIRYAVRPHGTEGKQQ